MTYEPTYNVLMNQCTTCGALPGVPCVGVESAHGERRAIDRFVRGLTAKHRYVDHLTTPWGMLVCSPACEHCDGEKSRWVRQDELRGWVCPICDDVIDAMLAEPDDEPKEAP